MCWPFRWLDLLLPTVTVPNERCGSGRAGCLPGGDRCRVRRATLEPGGANRFDVIRERERAAGRRVFVGCRRDAALEQHPAAAGGQTVEAVRLRPGRGIPVENDGKI